MLIGVYGPAIQAITSEAYVVGETQYLSNQKSKIRIEKV